MHWHSHGPTLHIGDDRSWDFQKLVEFCTDYPYSVLFNQCSIVPYTARGVATGVYIGIYTARKLAQVNFLWGKNDVSTAIQQFYTPPNKNFYTPAPPKKKKFCLRPCILLVKCVIVSCRLCL